MLSEDGYKAIAERAPELQAQSEAYMDWRDEQMRKAKIKPPKRGAS